MRYHPHNFMSNSPTVVYILGPMRGKDKYNFPAFDAMVEKIWARGYGVVNPAQLDREAGFDPSTLPANHDYSVLPSTMQLDDIVNRDLDALKTCNAYVALDGWENSMGARAEKAVLDWKRAIRLDSNTLESMGQLVSPGGPETVIMNSNSMNTGAGGTGAAQAGTNPKDICGMKKPPLTLIPTASLIYLARVMELGAKKYTPFNWRNPKTPVRATVYLAAAWRHLLQILDGDDIDSESNQPHAAHAMACFAIMLDAQACGTLVDDRPLKGAATKTINELTTK